VFQAFCYRICSCAIERGERVARLSACLCSKHFDNKSGSFIVEKSKEDKEKEWENRSMTARVPSILI
jgi:hypothetical protein